MALLGPLKKKGERGSCFRKSSPERPAQEAYKTFAWIFAGALQPEKRQVAPQYLVYFVTVTFNICMGCNLCMCVQVSITYTENVYIKSMIQNSKAKILCTDVLWWWWNYDKQHGEFNPCYIYKNIYVYVHTYML